MLFEWSTLLFKHFSFHVHTLASQDAEYGFLLQIVTDHFKLDCFSSGKNIHPVTE